MHRLRILFLALAIALSGCVSARTLNREADRLFRSGRYEEAALKLEEDFKKRGPEHQDSLLYLLDLGLIWHTAGRFDKSNSYLLKAHRAAEIKDYTSLGKEAATLLVSENIQDYKGEDFENVLINVYLAMNFAEAGNIESALVETRRVNRKLYLMVNQGKRKYKQSAFAHTLSGILYELTGEKDNAYISYKNAYKIVPESRVVQRALWRLSWVLGREDDRERWEKEFSFSESEKEELRGYLARNGWSELIIFYENGISPIKRSNPQFRTLPKFYPRNNPVSRAQVLVNGQARGDTQILDDIEARAMQNLEEKYGAMVAKKIAGVVAKEVVAHQVEKATKNKFWGALTRFVLYASDQADVRSWNLLPRDLQIARVWLKPGTYNVGLFLPEIDRELPSKEVKISRVGQKVFLNFRYIPL